MLLLLDAPLSEFFGEPLRLNAGVTQGLTQQVSERWRISFFSSFIKNENFVPCPMLFYF
jgi:hypothetical protein